jgi:hypothetical protein
MTDVGIVGVEALREAASRFAEGGCCGKSSKVRLEDIGGLGLLPIPPTFDSTLGRIVPLLGWQELCVWVHESLVGPFPAQERLADGSVIDPGEVVAAGLRKLTEELR